MPQELLRTLNDRASRSEETIARVTICSVRRINFGANSAVNDPPMRAVCLEKSPQIKTTLHHVTPSRETAPLLEDVGRLRANQSDVEPCRCHGGRNRADVRQALSKLRDARFTKYDRRQRAGSIKHSTSIQKTSTKLLDNMRHVTENLGVTATIRPGP